MEGEGGGEGEGTTLVSIPHRLLIVAFNYEQKNTMQTPVHVSRSNQHSVPVHGISHCTDRHITACNKVQEQDTFI